MKTKQSEKHLKSKVSGINPRVRGDQLPGAAFRLLSIFWERDGYVRGTFISMGSLIRMRALIDKKEHIQWGALIKSVLDRTITIR